MDFFTKYIVFPIAIILGLIVLMFAIGNIKNSGLNRVFNGVDTKFDQAVQPGSISSKVRVITPEIISPTNVACTMDAYMCSDGSYVGRTGSDCSFHCPNGQIIR